MVTASTAARPPCNIHPTAVVAEKAQLTGTHQIEIGANTIIQPYAKIQADGGPISIGSYCIVAEAVVVSVPEGSGGEVVLGDYITLQSGARITAAKVGDNCDLGIASRVEDGAVLGKNCKLAPKQIVKVKETLSNFTVVYGDDQRRMDATAISDEKYRAARITTQQRHVDVLRKIVPNAAAKYAAAV